jgi:glycosyltransferase involved in cell wall biosynthesis
MNILFCTYPWAFDCPGGGERQLLAYKDHLGKNNVCVYLYDPWRPQLEGCDIFHFFSVQPGSIHFCNYIKSKGIKLVISPNLWITHETKSQYPFKEIWNLFEVADRVVVNSNMEGNYMSDVFSMPREKFVTVYNGVEAEFLIEESSDRFRQKFNIQKSYVLTVANVEPRKNMETFLQAMHNFPQFDYVVIGNIRDEGYAEKCRKIGGNRLHIVGPMPYNSSLLRSAIAGCEFFAMPSILETPSIAALEAACAGAKILVTEGGSTREYFGGSVIYVDPFSIDSMADGIRKVQQWTNEHSQWVVRDRYMWPKCITALEKVYNDLL